MATPIVQFGTSRFLQAHVDLFVSDARAEGQEAGPITVVQTSGSAARAGLGRAHLPVCLAPPDWPHQRGDWSRELWLLRHPARRGDPAVEAVIAWLDTEVAPRLACAL